MTQGASRRKTRLAVGNDNTALQRSSDCLGPITHVQFGKYANGVIANSVFAVTEYCGNLAVGKAGDQQFQHF
jgi:hypothetical protein